MSNHCLYRIKKKAKLFISFKKNYTLSNVECQLCKKPEIYFVDNDIYYKWDVVGEREIHIFFLKCRTKKKEFKIRGKGYIYL